MNKLTLEKFGNTYVQTVYCCKQPHRSGEYHVGLSWHVLGRDWNSYDISKMPATVDNGEDSKHFPASDRKSAKQYAKDLCIKYGLLLND